MSSNESASPRIGFNCPGCQTTRLVPEPHPRQGEIIIPGVCPKCAHAVGKLMYLGSTWRVIRDRKQPTKAQRKEMTH